MLNLLLKDIGELNYFLGIHVEHIADGGLHLNQSKYITDRICRTKMQNAKGCQHLCLGVKGCPRLVVIQWKIHSCIGVLLGHYSMQ